eukprot:scaffold109612_cov60-Phaeocystis_antarctica.AAC.3
MSRRFRVYSLRARAYSLRTLGTCAFHWRQTAHSAGCGPAERATSHGRRLAARGEGTRGDSEYRNSFSYSSEHEPP